MNNTQNPAPDVPDADQPPSVDTDGDGLDLSGLPEQVAAKAKRFAQQAYTQDLAAQLGQIPRPINWRTLPPDDLEHELLELNSWVNWLRHEYGLPTQVIPPMWHRHPELLWELSALRQHWLGCYDPQAKPNQALAWHHDFAVSRERLRDWVTTSGTRLDRDRRTSGYVPYGDRRFFVEADHRPDPDLGVLTELFIRLALERVADARELRDRKANPSTLKSRSHP